MVKRYEILETLPVYGPMYISVSPDWKNYFKEGFVIRFLKDDNSFWVANFVRGFSELDAVFEFVNNQNLLVIAGGQCYIMNPNSIKPVSVFGLEYELLTKTSDGRIILFDLTGITVIETSGEFWHSKQISWDGLKELKFEGGRVSGLSFNPMKENEEWDKFELDLNTRILTGGSYKEF